MYSSLNVIYREVKAKEFTKCFIILNKIEDRIPLHLFLNVQSEPNSTWQPLIDCKTLVLYM